MTSTSLSLSLSHTHTHTYDCRAAPPHDYVHDSQQVIDEGAEDALPIWRVQQIQRVVRGFGVISAVQLGFPRLLPASITPCSCRVPLRGPSSSHSFSRSIAGGNRGAKQLAIERL